MKVTEEPVGDEQDPTRSKDKERIKLDGLQETPAGKPDGPDFTKSGQVETSDISDEDPNMFEVSNDEQPASAVTCTPTSSTKGCPAKGVIKKRMDVIQEALTNGVIPKPPKTIKPQRDNLNRTPRNRKICVQKDERLENDDVGKIHYEMAPVPSINSSCSTPSALFERKGEVKSREGSGDLPEDGIKQTGEKSRSGSHEPSPRVTYDKDLERSPSISAGQRFKTKSLEEFERVEELLSRATDNRLVPLSYVKIPSIGLLNTNNHWSKVKSRSLEEFEKLELIACKSPDNRWMPISPFGLPDKDLIKSQTKSAFHRIISLLQGDRKTKELKLPTGDSRKFNKTKSDGKVTILKNLSTNCLLATKNIPIQRKELIDGAAIHRNCESSAIKEKTCPTASVMDPNNKSQILSYKDRKKNFKGKSKKIFTSEQTGKVHSPTLESKSSESSSGSGRKSGAMDDSKYDMDTKEFLAKIRSQEKNTFKRKTWFKNIKMGSVKVMQVIKEGKVTMFAPRIRLDTDQQRVLKGLKRIAREIRKNSKAFKYRCARLDIEKQMGLKGSSIPISSQKRRARKLQKPSKIPVPIQSSTKSLRVDSKTYALPVTTKQKLILLYTSVENIRPSKIPIIEKVWIRKSVKHRLGRHPYVTSLKRSRIPVKRRSTMTGKVGYINITGLKIKRGDHLLLRKGLDIATMSKRQIEKLEQEAELFNRLMDNYMLEIEYLDLYCKERRKHFEYQNDITNILGFDERKEMFEDDKDGSLAQRSNQKVPALSQQNQIRQKFGKKWLTQGTPSARPNVKKATEKKPKQKVIIPKMTRKEQLQLQALKEKQLAKNGGHVEQTLQEERTQSITKPDCSRNVTTPQTITSQGKAAPVRQLPKQTIVPSEKRGGSENSTLGFYKQNGNNHHLGNEKLSTIQSQQCSTTALKQRSDKQAVSWDVNLKDDGPPEEDKQQFPEKTDASASDAEFGNITSAVNKTVLLQVQSERSSGKTSVFRDLTWTNNETQDVSPLQTITCQAKTAPVKQLPEQSIVPLEQRVGSKNSSFSFTQQNGNNHKLEHEELSAGKPKECSTTTLKQRSEKKAVSWEVNWKDNEPSEKDQQKVSGKIDTSDSDAKLGNITLANNKIAVPQNKAKMLLGKKSISWDPTLINKETQDEDTQKVLEKISISSSDAEVNTIKTVTKRTIFPQIKPQANNSSHLRMQGTSQNRKVLKFPPLSNNKEIAVFYSFKAIDGDEKVTCPPAKKTEEKIILPKINHMPSSNNARVDKFKAKYNKDTLPSLPQIKNFSKPDIQGICKEDSNVPKLPNINGSRDKFVPYTFKDNVGHEKVVHSSVLKQEKDNKKFKKTKQSRNTHVERMKAGQEKRRQKAEIPIPWFHRD